jgi:hypothetical protein
MTTIINASTSSGLVVTSDNSGSIDIQYAGKSAPCFSVYSTTNQATSGSGTTTIVTWNNTIVNIGNCYASNVFTPNVAGYYLINYLVTISSTVGTAYVRLYKNGSLYKGSSYGAGYVGGSSMSTVAYANGTTDYFDVRIYNGTDTVVNINADQSQGEFSGFLIRSA